MEKIPLHLKLKRKSHKDIARLQDIVIDVLYKIFPNAILHGGTAIWRCYNGNRFSEAGSCIQDQPTQDNQRI